MVCYYTPVCHRDGVVAWSCIGGNDCIISHIHGSNQKSYSRDESGTGIDQPRILSPEGKGRSVCACVCVYVCVCM